MSRHLNLMAAAALMCVGGCGFLTHPFEKSPPAQAATTRPAAPDADATAPGSATQPAGAVNPTALASQTTAFAQSMQAQIERRAKPPAAAAPAAPSPFGSGFSPVVDTSGIRWLDPQNHDLTLMPKQDSAEPYPSQAKDAPPPAARTSDPAPAQPTAAARADSLVHEAQVNSDQLEIQLAQRLKDNPRNLDAAIQYQILQFLRGRAVPQMEAIASLSSEDREMISALMDALTNLRANARGGDNMLLSRKARPLIELADRIRAESGLNIPAIALCTKIDSFGRYEPLPPDRIRAGLEIPVYCEVENFLTRLDDRGMWQTKLSHEMVLYDDSGHRVAAEPRRPVADISRNRRHDLYIPRLLRLPATLSPGQYTLKISIIDQQANRMAESSVPLRIPSPVESLPVSAEAK